MSPDRSAVKRFVVVATYNESANLRPLVAAVFMVMPDARLVIVDDNSPDGSPTLLLEMAAGEPRLLPIIREKKDGYGGAMLTGFQKALSMGADEIATLDADFSHDPCALPQMFHALETADVALGSRYVGGVRVLNWHASRLMLSMFANHYVIAILSLPVADATSGYRAYRRSALEKVVESGIHSVGYSFLVEVLYGLIKQGCKVVEVPIIYTERREGQSKMSKGVIVEAIFRPWVVRFRRKG